MPIAPLRILLVDHAPIIGGVEMMIRDLLTAIDAERIAPIVVTDNHSPMRGRFSKRYPEIAISLTRLKRNPLAAFSLLNSVIQLVRVAHQTRAQIIQTFTARTHLIGSLAGALSGIPVVWRLNDDTLHQPLAALIRKVPRRIISVSDYLRTYYAGFLHVTDLIPDGVHLPTPTASAEARHSLNLPPQALIVTVMARIVRWKGQSIFLRALAPLVLDFPDVYGLIVGGWSKADNVPGPLGGGEAYQRELEILRDQLGLTARVMFTGHVEATVQVLAASDVVVHTSALPEPFGRVIVEAMAMERPVVAVRAGGAQEIVIDGVTGLLVPQGEPEALTLALRQLLRNHGLRQAMGKAGRIRAIAEYSLQRMAERFTAVWAEVVHS